MSSVLPQLVWPLFYSLVTRSHCPFQIQNPYPPCHEQSTCNIKKDDPLHQLLQQTSLIIWDEVGSQHHHVIECIDRSLHDLLNRDLPFGGITILFGGDFRQTLLSSSMDHGRLYVALSRCTHPRNIKVLFPTEENTKVTNVVWTEVFRRLEI